MLLRSSSSLDMKEIELRNLEYQRQMQKLSRVEYTSLEAEFEAFHLTKNSIQQLVEQMTPEKDTVTAKEQSEESREVVSLIEPKEEEDNNGLDISSQGLGFNPNYFHVGTVYILLALSFFGVCGLHRIYLRKYKTGAIFLFTCGIFGIGTLFDIFTLNLLIRHAEELAQTKKNHLYPFRAFRKLFMFEMADLKASVKRELFLILLAITNTIVELSTIAAKSFLYSLKTFGRTTGSVIATYLAATFESSFLVLDAVFQVIRTIYRAVHTILTILYLATVDLVFALYHSIALAYFSIVSANSALWKGCYNIGKLQLIALRNVTSTGLLASIIKLFQLINTVIQTIYQLLRTIF